MNKLFFSNTEFKSGQNFTVRLGTKWKDRVDIGDVVWIENFPNDHLGQIHEIICCRLDSIPSRVFKNEHDPACRNIDGLIKVFEECYEEFKGLATEKGGATPITCIGFTVYYCDQPRAAKEG